MGYVYSVVITVCEKYAKLHDVFNGTKSKILIYNKKDADPHFKVNGIDIPSCESCVYLGNIPSTMNAHGSVLEVIKKCNCCFNMFMAEFG